MYNVWLAGYYDDFMGARAISDDFNTPTTTAADGYESTLTHYGNPINGEATLNQRYRFSIADRNLLGSTHISGVSSSNQYIKNTGAFEWLSYDASRQNPEKWEGRAQLQYPDGHIANRYYYNNQAVGGSNVDWLLFTNGNDTNDRYLIPTGDNDATFGRSNMDSYHSTNYASKVAGKINAVGDFIQRAHLTGVWMGETLSFNSSSSQPANLFAPVSSPSGQSFLSVQTWRTAYNDGDGKPQLLYDGSLNSLLDGDVFTARVAVRAFNGKTTNLGEVDTNLTFKIGYPVAQRGVLTSLGFSGTPAVTYTIDLSSASVDYDCLGLEWEGSSTQNNILVDDMWLDVDFVLNYSGNSGAGTFDVYIDGTLKASNQNMSGNPDAGSLYGYEIYAQPKTNSFPSSTTTLMVDRVGLVRYLTDAENYKSYNAPIQSLDVVFPVNGPSNCRLIISDDPQREIGGTENLNVGMRSEDYLHNLKNIFSGDEPVDWSLIIFANQTPRIDRPVWKGIINKMNITQKEKKREILLNASDNLSLIDRQVPLWEIGQKSVSDNTTTPYYWLYDAQGYRQIMNLGTLPLKVFNNTIGFDVDDSYLEVSNQRTQLGSGHPIQMYNNEDENFGPNSLESQYEGFQSLGFYQDTSGRTVIALPSGHGIQVGSSQTLKNSPNSATNGTYTVLAVDTNGYNITLSSSNVPYATPTAKVVYAGKYTGMDTLPLGMQLIIWLQYVKDTKPAAGDKTSDFVTVFFDNDPALSINDTFYLNAVTDTPQTNSMWAAEHTVSKINKIRNYFSSYSTIPYLWCVTTKTLYDGSTEFGSYTDGGLKVDDNRKSISTDTAIVLSTTGTFDLVKTKPLHARWMRDLPNSLWFQYHYGNIKKDELFVCNQVSNVNANDNKVQITSAMYNSIRIYHNNGIAQLSDNFGNVTKFIYTGVISSGGNYYLIGCKYITRTYFQATTFQIKILDLSDDYKHLWLLWSDMRNNGKADADGSTRKIDFGLQYPTNDNYRLSLYYVDQTDTDGNIDKFATLKIGEDVNIWNVDATNEPVSGAAFSKTPDYSLGEAPSAFTYGSNQLIIEGLTESIYTVGSYATVYNSLHYDGTYKIVSINGSTSITLSGVTAGTNTNPVIGSVMVAPAAASETDLDIYHDWEDKAGAFLVIDSSPFFNLNTLANKGQTGQHTGSETDLEDYVATVEGFPALIDNYYAEAISSYKTTASPIGEHPNNRRLLSDVTLGDEGLIVGDIGLPVDNTSQFATQGTGLIVVDITSSDDTVEYYFAWAGKLATEVVNTNITSVVANPLSVTDVGENTRIVKTGETFVTKGVSTGFLIKKTNVTPTTRHKVLRVENETTLIVSGVWAAADSYTLPVQLGNIFMTTAKNITSTIETSSTAIEKEIWGLYVDEFTGNWLGLGVNASQTIVGETKQADSIAVHTTVSSQYMLRLLMHLEGDVKSKNSGTFYESDKFRMLWNAAIMKSWTPKTRLGFMYDINNIPNTTIMTTYNDTGSNDSYGSVVDSRTKTLLSTIEDSRSKSGFGVTNGLKTTFSYLVGKDGRFEYRPKYNSGLIFTRENLSISDLSTDVAGQISNVRVYYNKGKTFVDYPNADVADTTRWKILDYPKINSSAEAQAVAQQTYNQNQKSRLAISASPVLNSNTIENKMIDSGRFGYIADPQLALQGYNDYSASDTNRGNSWTILGTGGVPFSGMVNGLDGNMKTSTDLYHRYGQSRRQLDTTTASVITWDNNYYWYGSRSVSYALQVVHIPNFTPSTSKTTKENLRVFISLKTNQPATATIDDCEFTIHLADYSFATINKTEDLQNNQGTSKNVKHSGFYELDIPSNYSDQTGAKIVISFNAEYCRALLRHRCGDPVHADILKNANSVNGFNLDSDGDGTGSFNPKSIFPLGGKNYTEMSGGFTVQRNEWYAPRIHITNDLSYTPATYLSYTDAGIGMSSAETLTINSVHWLVKAGTKEQVNLSLERDESLSAGGVLGYLFPNQGKTRQVSSISSTDERVGTPATEIIPENESSSTNIDPTWQGPSQFGLTNPDGASTIIETANRLSFGAGISISTLSSGAYGNIKGRMSLINDNLSHNSKFSVLGQQKPPKVPSLLKSIEGMDVDIQTASGNASVSSEGYTLAGKGRVDVLGETATTTTFESTLQTEFIIPDDVISNDILVSSKITHAAGSTLNTTAVLYTTATVKETGESISNTIYIKTNTDNKNIELIPQNSLLGIKSGNKITVKITRKAATGHDDSNRNSVLLKSIKVNLKRATAPVDGSSNKFNIQ